MAIFFLFSQSRLRKLRFGSSKFRLTDDGKVKALARLQRFRPMPCWLYHYGERITIPQVNEFRAKVNVPVGTNYVP